MRDRTDARVACLVLAAVLAVACSDASQPAPRPRTTSTVPATPASRTTSSTTIIPNEEDLVQDDDIPARRALLRSDQLPAGTWTSRSQPLYRWATSAQGLLSVDGCIARPADIDATNVPRVGKARGSWLEAGRRVQIDAGIELFADRAKVDALHRLLTGRALSKCFTTVMQLQANVEPRTTVRDIEVRRYETGLNAAALRMEFVDGVDVSMVEEVGRDRAAISVRIVSFGVGGELGTVTRIERSAPGSRPDLDTAGFRRTVRAAVRDLMLHG